MKISSPTFRNSSANFLVDPGSDLNLIKTQALLPELTFNPKHSVLLAGITEHPVKTISTIEIPIFDSQVEFHVIKNDFPVTSDGIIGRPYLRQEQAQLSFRHNTMVTKSKPITPIYFIDEESKEAKRNLQSEIKPFSRILKIQARTRQPVLVDVANPELTDDYLPRIDTPKGLFMGEAVVTVRDGVCHIYAINTTSEDVELEIPAQKIIPCDTYEFPGDDTSETDFEELTKNIDQELAQQESMNPPVNRAEKVMNALHLSHLTQEEKDYVCQWVNDFPDIFHLNGEQLTYTNMIQHRIPTTDDKVIFKKPYRHPQTTEDEVRTQIEKQLDSGILKESKSPYNSPIMIVPKKMDASGKRKFRVVVDFRALNEKVIGDSYPLPNITDILDHLGKAQYFSVFDLASGFHQVETHPDDRIKTAFSTPRGHFEYLRMPMGIKNAPATFQRLMDNVLTGINSTEAFIYLDDIIHAENLEDHDNKVRRLFDRLRKANLKLQPDKCDFLLTEVAYLGHIIGRDGVKPNPAKIEAIKKFPQPKTAKAVRQFLGLSGYYRRFMKDYVKLSKPLTELLKKDTKFEWGTTQKQSFRKLRRYLCDNPILQYSDFNKKCKLTTDASENAVGDMLTQEKEGMDMPVAYFSKVINDYERNYSPEEKECLALLYAVNNFRPYLYGREFILACDNKPVHWMTYVENPGTRLIKWRLKLKDYQYTYEYKKGKLNKSVEALSENPIADQEDVDSSSSYDSEDSSCQENLIVAKKSAESEINTDFSRVLVIHDRCPKYKALPISKNETSPLKNTL